MIYTLTRIVQSSEGTFGHLNDENGLQLCVTGEPPLGVDHPCISVGTYHCVPHNSPNHPNTWELQNVVGRSNILIHDGNVPVIYTDSEGKEHHDTEGCILVGKAFGWIETHQAVVESKVTLGFLRKTFPQEFDLTIVENFI